MKLQFLGGVDEVGASCTLIDIAGHRILVDCGIRMKERGGTNLPDLSQIQKGGVEAVILTHSHIDHSGALPVIYQIYDIPLYLTPATLSLIKVMLLDAINIIQIEMQQEGEMPLYSIHEVEKVIASARPVPFLKTVELFGGEVICTFHPCGHILGAASVLLESREDGAVLISGDISVTDQLTVSGMPLLRRKVDAVVLESTYGGRLHADRKIEERRLIEQAAKTIEKRGRMLIPAFAVGRSQEVILILSRAMETERLAKAPIIVDGLVRSICQVYNSYPEIVTHWLRRRMKKCGNPFFHDEEIVIPVREPKKRIEYASLRPAIIISSSGMLAGGPSQMYAQELAGDPDSFIAITGYQDEESPGRRIQELAEVGGGELQIGDAVVALRCGIGTYSLSAHADTTQLVGIAKSLTPREIILVHGDFQAREDLKRALERSGIQKIHLPGLVDEIVVERSGKKKALRLRKKEGEMELLKADDLLNLAQMLLDRNEPYHPYTIQELLVAWDYPTSSISDEEIRRVQELLNAKNSPFKQDSKKTFLYRVRVTTEGEIRCGKEGSDVEGRWEQNRTSQRIDELIPKEAGLYKKSFKPVTNELILTFYFPKIARERYAKVIEQIHEETRWNIAISPRGHDERLREEALKAIPAGWPIKRQPAIYWEEGKVAIRLAMANPPLEEAREGIERFRQVTGFELQILAHPVSLPCQTFSTAPQVPILAPQASQAKMEINRAYAEIRKNFQNLPHQPLKMSLVGDHIELTFISPQVAERYGSVLENLAKDTGWPLRIKQHSDQWGMMQMARAMLSSGWEIVKGPSVFTAHSLVVVEVARLRGEEEAKSIAEKFFEKTGYELSIKAAIERQSPSPPQDMPCITIPLRNIIIPARLRNAVLNPARTESLRKAYEALQRTPEPIDVKQIGENRYLLIKGLRRIRIAEELGFKSIEARVVVE